MPPVLQVAIGLFLIYFLLSSMCSAINEWVGALTASRSRSLEAGIKHLLNDPRGSVLAKQVLEHPLLKTLTTPSRVSLPGLLGVLWSGFTRPTYIPANLFVLALIDRIAPLEKTSPPRTFGDIWNRLHDLFTKNQADIERLVQEATELRAANKPSDAREKEHLAKRAAANVDTYRLLLALAGEAPNDLAAFQKNLERWYDEGMERISGWYKRKTQIMILLISACVSIVLNADTLMYLQFLTQDTAARAALSTAAEDLVRKSDEAGTETSKKNATPKKEATPKNETTPKTEPTPNKNATPKNEPPAKKDEAPPTDVAAKADGESNGSSADTTREAAETQIKEINAQLESLGLPVGWDFSEFDWGAFLKSFITAKSAVKETKPAPGQSAPKPTLVQKLRRFPTDTEDWLYKGLGLLFSTLALSMGAPFYFDLLNRLVNVRMTGIPPDEKTPSSSPGGPEALNA